MARQRKLSRRSEHRLSQGGRGKGPASTVTQESWNGSVQARACVVLICLATDLLVKLLIINRAAGDLLVDTVVSSCSIFYQDTTLP